MQSFDKNPSLRLQRSCDNGKNPRLPSLAILINRPESESCRHNYETRPFWEHPRQVSKASEEWSQRTYCYKIVSVLRRNHDF